MDDFFFPFPNVFSWSNFHGLGSSIAIKRKRKRNEKKHRKFRQLITYPSETDMCVCRSIHHIKCQQKIKYTASMISLMKLVLRNCWDCCSRISHSLKYVHKHNTETDYKFLKRRSPAKFKALLKILHCTGHYHFSNFIDIIVRLKF